MNRPTLRRFLLGSLLSLAWLSAAAAAESPRDELLRLVPEDAGFCLVLQDARGHSEALLASPFLEQVQKSPLGQTVTASAELKTLFSFQKRLEDSAGLDFLKLRDEVFGDAVVFAYRPPPADDPKAEQDLLLVRARDAKVLADFVERVNKVQKDGGDLKQTEEREYHGRKYLRRVEKRDENFVYFRGPLLVVSSKERAIQEAIDRDLKASTGEPPLAARLRGLGVDGALLVCWVNPRPFDAMVTARAEEAKDGQAALTTFRDCWKALDDIALALEVNKNLELSLAVKARMDKLPPGVRRFLTEAGKPSELWDRFPDDALFAVAGRADAPALLDALGEFLSAEERQNLLDGLERSLGAALGQSAVKDVLPNVGPDWGLCVTAPAGDKSWFPHVVAAVRVSPGQKTPSVDAALWRTLDSYALLAVLDYNRQHKDQMTLKTEADGKSEIRSLVSEQLFPPGVQPAYALNGGYLVLGSSPEVVRRFAVAVAPKNRPDASEFPLLRMSLKDLREFVKQRREPLAQAVADRNQISKDEALGRLDGLVLGLQLFDRLELVQRSGAGQTLLTLRLTPVKPLRK